MDLCAEIERLADRIALVRCEKLVPAQPTVVVAVIRFLSSGGGGVVDGRVGELEERRRGVACPRAGWVSMFRLEWQWKTVQPLGSNPPA